MPKFTYGQSAFGIVVPAGRYVCKFNGTEDRDPIQDGKYGNEGAPRMAWVFEVTEGPQKGELIAQETGIKATAKSGCARIILGLSGGQVAAGAQVDTDIYIGKVYVLKVGPNPNSDKGNLYVADVEPHNGSVPEAGKTPPPASKPSGPPPRRTTSKPAPVAQPPISAKFYVDDPKYPTDKAVETEEVSRHLFATGVKAEVLMLCKEGDQDWMPATHYGFETSPI